MAPNFFKYIPGARSDSSDKYSYSRLPSSAYTPLPTITTTSSSSSSTRTVVPTPPNPASTPTLPPPSISMTPALILEVETILETIILRIINPTYPYPASYPSLLKLFPHHPQPFVWELWGYLNHLSHPSNWNVLMSIYPHDALKRALVSSSPPGTDLITIYYTPILVGPDIHQQRKHQKPIKLPSTLPFTLLDLRSASRLASLTELTELLDTISNWVQRAARIGVGKLVSGSLENDSDEDWKVYSEQMHAATSTSSSSSSGQGTVSSRRRYHTEGPYGEPEWTPQRAQPGARPRVRTRTQTQAQSPLRVVNV
ncbi:hypothetical protein K435DRAFT_275101 [Dendrothele bispora CBS 962.96]|uniref:Uncharacterized protein n=1 Tax=Dendrothele bispora (strain CBS 962.96) TaxID=1314807 RepID=A0A4S8LLM2_DENBC|nr:hypothetical protein K435DRAFT_275101 [Dendrothele bispora CBS 962.96]